MFSKMILHARSAIAEMVNNGFVPQRQRNNGAVKNIKARMRGIAVVAGEHISNIIGNALQGIIGHTASSKRVYSY